MCDGGCCCARTEESGGETEWVSCICLNAKKNTVFRSDLLPLEVEWSCICPGKEMCFNQDNCVMRNPGCCFAENSHQIKLSHDDAVDSFSES